MKYDTHYFKYVVKQEIDLLWHVLFKIIELYGCLGRYIYDNMDKLYYRYTSPLNLGKVTKAFGSDEYFKFRKSRRQRDDEKSKAGS